MQAIDYIVVVLYFLGLVFVSGLVSRKIKTSEDMFIAGRNSWICSSPEGILPGGCRACPRI